ncbi:unnamed protein product [Mytilus coruscus]|uniref:Uncharacterized protein n=1 Tax=Mytilus coruscus TaxID=42192 RepID=A0A6J7ZUT0_MYTCO|nr:unnamed protein product [Mytilus coruscus]
MQQQVLMTFLPELVWVQTNIHKRTRAACTQTCLEDLEVLPQEILGKAVSLVNLIDQDILRNGDAHDVWEWLCSDFPTKVFILKDELLLYSKQTEKINLKEKLFKELIDYLINKIQKALDNALDDGRLNAQPYHSFCSNVSNTVLRDRYVNQPY